MVDSGARIHDVRRECQEGRPNETGPVQRRRKECHLSSDRGQYPKGWWSSWLRPGAWSLERERAPQAWVRVLHEVRAYAKGIHRCLPEDPFADSAKRHHHDVQWRGNRSPGTGFEIRYPVADAT